MSDSIICRFSQTVDPDRIDFAHYDQHNRPIEVSESLSRLDRFRMDFDVYGYRRYYQVTFVAARRCITSPGKPPNQLFSEPSHGKARIQRHGGTRDERNKSPV